MEGTLEKIFIADGPREPMKSMYRLIVLAGLGLDGDRYAKGIGSWQKRTDPKTMGHITLIEAESIENPSVELDEPFTPEQTRRNMVFRGIRLGPLLHQTWRIQGSILIRGVEVCTPCTWPAQLSGRDEKRHQDFIRAFPGIRAGMRVQVIMSGEVQVGAHIVPT